MGTVNWRYTVDQVCSAHTALLHMYAVSITMIMSLVVYISLILRFWLHKCRDVCLCLCRVYTMAGLHVICCKGVPMDFIASACVYAGCREEGGGHPEAVRSPSCKAPGIQISPSPGMGCLCHCPGLYTFACLYLCIFYLLPELCSVRDVKNNLTRCSAMLLSGYTAVSADCHHL